MGRAGVSPADGGAGGANPQEEWGLGKRGEGRAGGWGRPACREPPASVHLSPCSWADTGAAVGQGLRGSSVTWSLKGEVLVPGWSRPPPQAERRRVIKPNSLTAAPLPLAAGHRRSRPHVIQQILVPRADRLRGFSVPMTSRGPGRDTPLLRPSLQVAGLTYSSVRRRQAFPRYKWGN